MSTKEKVKVACVQMAVEKGKLEKNMQKILRWIDEAADNGAKLVVFPETAFNGYIFYDVNEAYELATTIPGPETDRICAKAEENDIYVVVGVAERVDYPDIYNSGILVGPRGSILGTYRKNFITMTDKKWCKPGNTGIQIFKTSIGNIGIFICGDGRIPEVARCEALEGAEIICGLEAWFTRDMYQFIKPSRAVENGVWLIESDRPKSEEYPVTYPGHSFIMDPKGNIVSEASEDKEEIIYGEIVPKKARNKKIGSRNDLFGDRRPPTYRLISTPTEKLPITKLLDTSIVPRRMSVTVYALQLHTKSTLEKLLHHIEPAANYHGKLIVTPELPISGCAFTKAEEALKIAKKHDGKITSAIVEIAKKYESYIVFTTIEEDGGKLYNTAFLAGSTGIVGKYRKIHLWNFEKLWCTPGDIEYPIFETEFGNIGIMIGYDGFFPEVSRILTLKGADVIVWPCSWTNQVYSKYICPVRAYENRVYIVAANRIGEEGEERYIGQSIIVDPTGRVVAEAGKDYEGHILSRINLAISRDKELQPAVDTCLDRRPETFKILSEDIARKAM